MLGKFPYLNSLVSRMELEFPLLRHNIKREYIFNNINNNRLHNLLESMDLICNGCKHQVDTLISELKKRDDIYFLGKTIEKKNIPNRVYHYKEFDSLWRHCLYKSVKKFSDPKLDTKREEIRNKLKNGEEIDPEIFEENGLADPRKGFFWVTNPDFALVENSQEIYNMIGKQRGDGEEDLVQFEITQAVLNSPTIFDAHFGQYFRTAMRNDGWGEALKVSLGDDFRGFPEAISEDVKIKVAINDKLIKNVRIIGKVRETSGYTVEQWSKLLEISKKEVEDYERKLSQ